MKVNTVAEYMDKRMKAEQAAARMAALRRRVVDQLDRMFDLSLFELSDTPFMPGGVILKDQQGQTVVFYWDILRGCVSEAS